jgi:hypothetical protein
MADLAPQMPPGSADPRTPRQQVLARLKALEKEADGWRSAWRDLALHCLPGSYREPGDVNRSAEKLGISEIINATPLLACRTMASGMMSGITSPARTWFKLTLPDPELADYAAVRTWLHHVEERMMMVFARSNIYNALPQMYANLGAQGTACMLLDADKEDTIRAYVWPIGLYYMMCSSRGVVDTVYRRVKMTVAQLFSVMPPERLSQRVQNMWKNKQYDEWVDLVHATEPNFDMDPQMIDQGGMPFRSAWMEIATDQEKQFLRSGGYQEFPYMCPRWDVRAEDTYGYGAGLLSLGDSKAVQLLERRKAQAVDLVVMPPMVGSTMLRSQRPTMLPGDVTYVESMQGPGFAPAYSMPPQAIGVLDEIIRQHEARIQKVFFADLWMMMQMDDRQQPITAREVAERHEEKLLQLGPTLERIHGELLDPLISRTFSLMTRQELIPPPPKELGGQELRVDYISIMSQAQKLVGIASDERLAGMVGNIASVNPEIIDKINWDKFVEGYAMKTSADPDILVSQDEVDKKRAARSQAQQKTQTIQNESVSAQSAKVLSETDVNGDTALNRLLYAQGGGAPLPQGRQ